MPLIAIDIWAGTKPVLTFGRFFMLSINEFNQKIVAVTGAY